RHPAAHRAGAAAPAPARSSRGQARAARPRPQGVPTSPGDSAARPAGAWPGRERTAAARSEGALREPWTNIESNDVAAQGAAGAAGSLARTGAPEAAQGYR